MCLWFANLPARSHAASHALLSRRSDAECHTAQVVSRDVGFHPAMPLSAVAILLRVCSEFTRRLFLPRLERVAALWKPLFFFKRRTQLDERLGVLVYLLALSRFGGNRYL